MQNFKQCEHCSTEYTLCKYNFNRQKFCKIPKCIKERDRIRKKKWEEDHAHLLINETERTAQYRAQKNFRNRLIRLIERKLLEQKRLFVAHQGTPVISGKNMLLTFAGIVYSMLGSGLQTSAISVQKKLEKCFEFGNRLNESDDFLTKYMEHMYEYDKTFNLS